MGHQLIIYGMIEGASLGGEHHRTLQERNEAVIAELPADDKWPWLTRSMFTLPANWPQGTYREQIIHFGLSMKEFPPTINFEPANDWPSKDHECLFGWVQKFEELLCKLYWHSANLHISTDFGPDQSIYYAPTRQAISEMLREEASPICDWTITIVDLPTP